MIEKMTRKRKEGYEMIHFTGGEPTRNKYLPEFIEKSRELGYSRIEMSSNACSLSDKKFCGDLIKRGMNGVTTTLHAHNSSIHDGITRTPGSFSKTIAGIENLLSFGNVNVSVGTVLMNPNYAYMERIGEKILSFGISKWSLIDLKPVGRAAKKNQYKSLAVKRSDLAKEIKKSLPVLSKFVYIGILDYHWCLFPKKLDNLFFYETANVEDNFKTDVTMSRPIEESPDKKSIFEDAFKKHLPMCEGCGFSTKCKGIWKIYSEIHGDSDVLPFEKYGNFKQ